MSIYERAKAWWLSTQRDQIKKGMEKYGRPLNPDEWTSEQLVDHIMQESVDLVHYTVALREKNRDLERENADLRERAEFYRKERDEARVKQAACFTASDAIDEFEKKNKTMDLRTKKGYFVVFSNRNGHKWQRVDAIEKGLTTGGVYTVDYVYIGSWRSDVYLVEFPGIGFNTVMFANAHERP